MDKLTPLHPEMPKLHTILAFLSAIGSKKIYIEPAGKEGCPRKACMPHLNLFQLDGSGNLEMGS